LAITGELSGARPFNEAAEVVLDLLVTALEADRAVLVYHVGPAPSDEDSESGAGRRSIVVPPAQGGHLIDDGDGKGDVPRLGDAGVNSLVALPLQIDGRMAGMLSLASSKPGRFDADKVSFVAGTIDVLRALLERENAARPEVVALQTPEASTLASIQDSMAEGLIVLDQEGKVILCNPAAEKMLRTGSELMGERLAEVLTRRARYFDSSEAVHDLVGLLENPPSESSMIDLVAVSPDHMDITISVFPIEPASSSAESNGSAHQTGLLLRNVTDEREIQRRRDTFVSVASHELRTPMTTVMGFTELLMSRNVSVERRERWLSHIFEDSRRVINIVDDLLNVSRIQAGKATADLRTLDLRRPGLAAIEAVRSQSDRHSLLLDIPVDLPAVVADSDKLGQVLVNLLSNAIKYSPQGGPVVLSARNDPSQRRIVVSVEDEGVGIADEDQERLFTTFYRVNRTETQGVRGTGLGLFIVKSLVELMRGEVWVESAVNRGSTFSFTLPVSP
ncbi:MAG: ATP-binding protein, partial [Dehalococcoidia bacterium]